MIPSPAGPLVQDSTGHPWGATLAPGSYPTLRETQLAETCVLSYPHHVQHLVSLYAAGMSVRLGPSTSTSTA